MKPIVSGCLLLWVLLFIACPPFAEDVCRENRDCAAGQVCNQETLRCVDESSCTPDCAGHNCGDDGCGGSCGDCEGEAVVCHEGACCTVDCSWRNCGDDDCGGSCGDCPANQVCNGGWCMDGCMIGDVFFEDGDASWENNCLICVPGESIDGFTALPVGASCDDGVACREESKCDALAICVVGESNCEDDRDCNVESGICEGESCLADQVEWGLSPSRCNAALPAIDDYGMETATNATAGLAGTATFECVNGEYRVVEEVSSCEPLNFEWALWPIPVESKAGSFQLHHPDQSIEDEDTELHWSSTIHTSDTHAIAVSQCPQKGQHWRLPTIIELRSLVHWGTHGEPHLDDIFGGDRSGGLIFWSSTPVSADTGGDMVWTNDFGNGDAVAMGSSAGLPYLCVRSRLALGSFTPFEPSAGQETRSPRTRLVWQKSPIEEGGINTFIYEAAGTKCSALNDGAGSPGWRLPTVRELLSLIDVEKAGVGMLHEEFDELGASHTEHQFWSSTVLRSDYQNAWLVDFKTGHADYLPKEYTLSVRCVRDEDGAP